MAKAYDAVRWVAGRAPACKKTRWWGAGVVVCLERGADLHMAQLMPLPLTVSCFSKIQIGFTFLVPAHLGSPGQRAVKRVSVCLLQSSLLKWIALGYDYDIHFSRVSIYPCFILYAVSKWDQISDIH